MTQEVKVILGIVVTSVLLIVGAAVLLGNMGAPSSPIDTTKVDQKLLLGSKRHATGSATPKVVIVEFGDYQCPACAMAHPMVKNILGAMADVEFVFRNYPLAMHPNAKLAAEAAEAAGAQGKFWEMYNKIFETQKNWSNKSNDDALAMFTEYAKGLALNVEQFQKEVLENKYKDIISADQNDGNLAGVNSTPTFYINGVLYDGGLDNTAFKQAIEKARK